MHGGAAVSVAPCSKKVLSPSLCGVCMFSPTATPYEGQAALDVTDVLFGKYFVLNKSASYLINI